MTVNILILLKSDFDIDSRVKKIMKMMFSFGNPVIICNSSKITSGNIRTVGFISKRRLLPGLALLSQFFSFIKVINKTQPHLFQVCYCNDLITLPMGVYIKLFFNHKIKIIYDAHEYEINQKPNQSKLSIFANYLLEKALIRFACSVITVSNSIADEYVRLYGIKKPALVLNCPPYKIVAQKDIFRKTLNIGKDQTIFLYQGGLSEGRGIEVILETYKELNSDTVVVFMGYGPMESLIKDYAQKHSNIFFHPAVTQDILLDYTASADYGILFYENTCLNNYYCSPNKMFEYIMAGIPVIVSNLYEMRKIVEQNNIGFIAEENTPICLRDTIQTAINQNRDQLRTNIDRLKTIYNWEEQEKILTRIIKEII